MTKLTDKEHEQQQQTRIKQLENDMKQQKSRIDKLVKRADAQQKELANLKKKL